MAAKTFEEYWKETASYNSINRAGCAAVWNAAIESINAEALKPSHNKQSTKLPACHCEYCYKGRCTVNNECRINQPFSTGR